MSDWPVVKNPIVWFHWPLGFDSGHSVNRTCQFLSPCLWGPIVLDRIFQMMKHFMRKKNPACFKCFDVSGRRLKTICTLCDKRNHLMFCLQWS